MNGNALTVLDHVIERLPSLKRIGISDNNWLCTYLHTFFNQLQANGIEIIVNPSISEDKDHVLNGIGCVRSETTSMTSTETQSNIVEKVKSELPALMETFCKSVTNDKPDNEMILRMFDTQKVELKNVIKTINEFVANHSDFDQIFQEILERQIETNKGIKIVCEPCIKDNNHSVDRIACTSTLVSIWLMGIVNVLLVISILLLYKQYRRSEKLLNFKNTPIVKI